MSNYHVTDLRARLMAGARGCLAAAVVATSQWGAAASSVEVSQEAGPADPATAMRETGGSVAGFLACLRDADVLLLAAHRGGPATGYPENAIETFAHTLAHGPMLIEVDVRSTRDGALVLMHDASLDRTTTGSGPVADASLAQIKALSLVDNSGAVTPYRVPTLEEALAWARGRAILQLDVKADTAIEEVASRVAARKAQGFAAVIAYSADDALDAAAIDPGLTLSIEIMDLQSLDKLVAAGIAEQRIMAWTGIQTEQPGLWRQLNERASQRRLGFLLVPGRNGA